QIPQLQISTPAGAFGWLHGVWLPAAQMLPMLGLIALTMSIIFLLPKLTTKIPAALVAIGTTTSIAIIWQLDTPTVATLLGTGEHISAGLPQFALPVVPLTFETFKIIFPYAAILAFIGLVESLMTMTLIDEITDTRGKSNIECVAQGTANVVTGLFGGMGGCAMVGQSMINIESGGRGRWSGLVAGVTLLAFILFAGKWIEMIPLAALVGVMFAVVIGTFAWSSLRVVSKIPRSDAFVLVFVSVVTVFTDLAVAVMAGIVMSALVFSWKKAQSLRVKTSIADDGSKHYKLIGHLFFASAHNFADLFTDYKHDPDCVYIDFAKSRVFDHSGIEAINTLTEKYLRAGKKLKLLHLSADCRKLLKNAEQVVAVNIAEDPIYEVADDELDS
ncbi:MAG: sodium-independent anion transporter, partial [Desulfocapsa sp.]